MKRRQAILIGTLVAGSVLVVLLVSLAAGDAQRLPDGVRGGWVALEIPERELHLARPGDWQSEVQRAQDGSKAGFQIRKTSPVAVDPEFTITVGFPKLTHTTIEAIVDERRTDLENQEARGAKWQMLPRVRVSGVLATVLEQRQTSPPPPEAGATQACDCISRWYLVPWGDHVLQVHFVAGTPGLFETYIPVAQEILSTIRRVPPVP